MQGSATSLTLHRAIHLRKRWISASSFPIWSLFATHLAFCWIGILASGLAQPALAQEANAATNPAVRVEGLPVSSSPQLTLELEDPPALPPARQSGHAVPAKYDVERIGERGIGEGVNMYSLEREQAMGRTLAEDVQRQTRMVTDSVITEYVNRVAQNIVHHSDAKVPYTVKLVDDEEINAFALPGGYFFVNSGLLLAADNEAQLAGVMAHEIAHVAARHATKNVTRQQIFNVVSLPLIFFGGPLAYAASQVAGLALPVSMLKFSRDAEREADLLGLEYAYAAGYDPAELVRFFETIKAREGQTKQSFIAKAFSTHPMTKDRIESAQKEIETLLPPKNEYVVTTSEFEEIKSRLAKIDNRHRFGGGDSEKPTLRRRRTESPSAGGQTPDATEGENEPPTLRRQSQ